MSAARARFVRAALAVAVIGTVFTATSVEAQPTTSERTGFRGYLLDGKRLVKYDPADPDDRVFPAAINDFGVITGEYIRPDSESGLLRDARGRISTFDVPGARGTEAVKINNRGQIVVHYSFDTPIVNDSADPRSGVLYRGKVTPIRFPDATLTFANGINNFGKVAGAYLDGDRERGFLWNRGRFTKIDVPGATIVEPWAVNDRDQVVGAYANDPTAARGFLWDHGRITKFDIPFGQSKIPTGINNRGQIVGIAITFITPQLLEVHGFLLAKGATGPVTRVDVPGSVSTTAFGINNSGTMVGAYINIPQAPALLSATAQCGSALTGLKVLLPCTE